MNRYEGSRLGCLAAVVSCRKSKWLGVIGSVVIASGCAFPGGPAVEAPVVERGSPGSRVAVSAKRRAKRAKPMDTPAPGVIAYALRLNGSRYRFGGTSPSVGFDCSGFVQHVYGRHGVALPRDAQSMAGSLPEVRRDEVLPGDLMFFKISRRPYSHVGIYLGGRRFIHATSRRTGDVRVSSLDLPYWRTRLAGIRRPAVAARFPASGPPELAWSRPKEADRVVP